MPQSLLSLVQSATTELAVVAVPSAVATSNNVQNTQFMGLANSLGRMLTSDYEWQKVDGEHVITTVSTTFSCTTTEDSPIVTLSDTSSLSDDFGVSGTGIPTWTQILSVDSSTQITLDQDATSTGTSTLTFSQNRYDLPSDFE